MKRKFSVLLISMVLIIMSLTVHTNAADEALNFTTSMTASSQKVTPSTEVVVTVKVSNLNVGDNGINSLSAYIYFDDNVFENLTDSSVEGTNGWIAAFAPGTGKVTLQKNQFVKTDEEIMQISLKTKSGLTDGTQGEVRLTQIIASDSKTEISSSPVSTTITIGSGSTNIPSITNEVKNNTTSPIQLNPNLNENNNTNNNTNNDITNNSLNNIDNSSKNEVENIVESDIPYTGSEGSALAKIIIGIILLALIAYIKIQRLNDIK